MSSGALDFQAARIFCRNVLLLCVPVAGFAGSLAAQSPAGRGSCISLQQVQQSALERTEAIAIQAAAMEKAEAGYSAAKAAVMPSIGVSGSMVMQDATDAAVALGGAETTTQTSSKISLSQPLFKGGREYAALRAAAADVEAETSKGEATRISVSRAVTGGYFAALLAQSEVAALKELRDLSARRDAQIKGRVAIGKSRATDGMGSEVQLANAKAQLDVATMQQESTRRFLASSAGLSVDVAEMLDKSGVCDVALGDVPLANWSDVEGKIRNRPDLVAERIALKISGERVAIARAGHLPSLDLGANYHLKRAESRLDGSDWDVTLTATLPLFSGGSVRASVREAKALEMQQAQRLKKAEREAIDEGRDLWERYQSGRKQIELLEEAARKSESYYRRVAQDERMGLATSLETLQALNSSIDSRRAAVKARVQLAQTWRELLLVTQEKTAGAGE